MLDRLRTARALAFIAAVGAATLPASAATYAATAARPSVIWVSQAPAGSPSPSTDPEVRQTGKTFVPAFLVIPVGSSVRFPNDDAFYHSVYSDSASNPFDLGLYDSGPGKSVLFDQPGVVVIRCHVHGSMHATVLVVDGPFVTTTKLNERYTIGGLTPGAHELHVYSGGTTYGTTPIRVR